MQIISIADIKEWERFYRANVINGISGFRSAQLLSTINQNGLPNLALISNVFHIGADPALVGYINRPVQATPHSLQNIRNTKSYCFNWVENSFLEKAHQASAKYGDGIDEFTATGLTPAFIEGNFVPYVFESKVNYWLSLEEILEIKLNNTFLVIGSIQQIRAPENFIDSTGNLKTASMMPLACLGLEQYHSLHFEKKLLHAKPQIL